MNKKQRKRKHKRHRAHEHQDVIRPQQMPGHTQRTQPVKQNSGLNQLTPLWTKTGELFQPVRVYYAVRNPRKIQQRLESLVCVQRKSDENCWSWMYAGEASEIAFEKGPIRSRDPIELGTLSLCGERGMFLDLHSIERALAAMTFFDRHFAHRLARISHVSIVNNLFDPQGVRTFQFPYCSASDAETDDPVLALFNKFDRLNKRGRSSQQKYDAMVSYLQTMSIPQFPRIEHLALQFSRKRLRQIRFLLESRQYVAIQRWKGNNRLTPADYVYALIHDEISMAFMK